MKLYWKLVAYASEKMKYAYASIIFAMISSFLWISSYWILWRFLEELLVKKNFENTKTYAIYMMFSLILYGVFYFFSLWSSHLLAFRLETNLRKKGIQHLLEASFSFFDVQASGKIRKIIDDNAAETHTIFAHILPDLVVAIMLPLLMLAILYKIDFKLFVSLLIMMLVGFYQIKDMIGEKEFMEQYMLALEKMNAEAVEYVRGMQVIKIFRNTVYSMKSFYQAILSYSNLALNYTKSCRNAYVCFQVLFHLFVAFCIPAAIFFLKKGENPDFILAEIIFYTCLSTTLFVCFMRIMYVGMYYFQGSQAIEKLEHLFEEMEIGKQKYGSVQEMKDFTIEFQGVSFRYAQEELIQNLSFRLEAKKTYAFVGFSGGGKSTIAKLISGFYKIQKGKILIGGRDIQEYSRNTLATNIAFVFQNTKLWKTSIFENVKMGRANATREEVLEALRLARCEDILEKFPEREQTIIGAEGVYLSGGEIQRIAIARAILKDAKIIILDEASAGADPENEYEIQQAFTNLMRGKTVIMIAHRLSSIRKVDEILFIENGKIIERGRDSDLMKQEGKYYELQKLFLKANDWKVSYGKN